MKIIIQYWPILLIVAFFIFRLYKNTKIKNKLLEVLQSDHQIIDVRSPGEFESGHDPHAINIPLNTIQAQVEKVKKDIPVILVCQSGARSGSACKILSGQGFNQVINGGNWKNTLVRNEEI